LQQQQQLHKNDNTENMNYFARRSLTTATTTITTVEKMTATLKN